MTMIAGCPRCSTELLLPAEAGADAALECPVCGAKFERAAAGARRLPLARVVLSSTPEPHESESNDDSIELASSQSYDDLQSLSARLRSLQGVAATGPADRNHHNMSRLLGEAADEDAADEIEENEYGDELAVANDDSDDDQPTQQEVSAEIDAILKGAAETFDAATLVPEVHSGELASQAPAASDDEFVAGVTTEHIGDAAPSDASAAEDEPSASQLQELVGQFMLEPQRPAEDATARPASVISAEDEEAQVAADAEPFELPAFDNAGEQFAPAATIAPITVRRRPPARRRGLRMLAGVVGFGAVGILAGGYALLWIGGPHSDLLHLATVLPDAMLPTAMRASVDAPSDPPANSDGEMAGALAERIQRSTANEPPVVDEPIETATPLAEAEPAYGEDNVAATALHDSAVEPATASQPTPPAPVDVAELMTQAQGAPRPEFDELAAAIDQASAALPAFLAGDRNDPASVSRTGQAYVQLARMAEVLTLASPQIDPNALVTQQLLAKETLRQAATEAAQPVLLDHVSARWLDYPRRTNQGVILRGVIRNMQYSQDLTWCELEIVGVDAPRIVTVAFARNRHKLGEEIAVAGAVMPPGVVASLDNQAGTQPAVLAGCSVTLKQPERVAVPGIRLTP